MQARTHNRSAEPPPVRPHGPRRRLPAPRLTDRTRVSVQLQQGVTHRDCGCEGAPNALASWAALEAAGDGSGGGAAAQPEAVTAGV